MDFGRVVVITLLLLGPGCARMYIRSAEPREDEELKWSYSGKSGPDRWSEIEPQCGGTSQSPINITAAEPRDLPPLEFEYATIDGIPMDAGRFLTIESEGGTMLIEERVHTLQRIEIHLPAEHTIEGSRTLGELQLVHLDPDSQMVVLSVFLTEGAENAFISQVLDELNEGVEYPEVELQQSDLLPKDLAYYAYTGSLTHPPCIEGVQWYVLRAPVEASAEQFAALAEYHVGNIRPLQPPGGRAIYISR